MGVAEEKRVSQAGVTTPKPVTPKVVEPPVTPKTNAFSGAQKGSGWRKEVNHNGTTWHWRRGDGRKTPKEYGRGGRFTDLSPERKAEYERNKKIKGHRTPRRKKSVGDPIG